MRRHRDSFGQSRAAAMLIATAAVALLMLIGKSCKAAETVNPHADIEIVLVTPGELAIIIADEHPAKPGEYEFPRCPPSTTAKGAPLSHESEDKKTIWLAKVRPVEMTRELLRILRERKLIVDDGRAFAPTEKGLDHGR